MARSADLGFAVEANAYFWLAQQASANRAPWHRYYIHGWERHFYTTDAACEGFLGCVSEGPTGYLSTVACGANSVPLYRLYKEATRDHLYTISADERASAQLSGYVDEGTVGTVWTTNTPTCP